MYILWHWLFGWHYIAYEFAGRTAISRIKTDIHGDPYIFAYGSIRRLDTLNDPLALTAGAQVALEYALGGTAG